MLRFVPPARAIVPLAMFAAMVFVTARPALAVKAFYDQFTEMYVTDETSEEYTKLVKKARCYVCHQGRNKKNHNPYGEALEEFLSKGDAKDTEKIVDALKKVGEMNSDADDKESPTYDELIAEGKLPGGPLEEVRKEPTEKEGSGDKS